MQEQDQYEFELLMVYLNLFCYSVCAHQSTCCIYIQRQLKTCNIFLMEYSKVLP